MGKHGMRKLLSIALLLAALPACAQQKYALVIGNAAYRNNQSLANPLNDAEDMKNALQNLGFQVDVLQNGSLDQMRQALVNLQTRLKNAGNAYGFFYYAGHGINAGGENYLIPSNAEIPAESSLRYTALAVQEVLDTLGSVGNTLNMVVLDSCRNNPFVWGRGGGRGLGMVSAPPGSIVFYATGKDSQAADGIGRNGLFTAQLLKHLNSPGISLQEMFNQTGVDVVQASGGAQYPELSYKYFGVPVYLGGRPSGATPPPAPAVAVPPASRPLANMVWVEGGTFRMGSNSGYDDEKPVHQVTVKGFYMDKYQVTQKEWREVMGTNPSHFKGDTLPVEQVSWNDAVEFCNKLSQKEGLIPCYQGSGNNVTCNWDASGYRLPTEAEWEYAARGGNKGSVTLTYAGSDSIDAVAWYYGNSGGTTHPVGGKAPNSLGLYDMSGNVFEWCWDWYSDSYSGGARTDPHGPASGSGRVKRGGSWGSDTSNARSACRFNGAPSDRNGNLGFRLVRP